MNVLFRRYYVIKQMSVLSKRTLHFKIKAHPANLERHQSFKSVLLNISPACIKGVIEKIKRSWKFLINTPNF